VNTRRRIAATVASAAALTLAPLAAPDALAQGGAPAPVPGQWQFDATLYAWFPAIGGSTNFPTTGGDPKLDVDAADVIDALKMAFFTTLTARKDRWGLLADWSYADLGASKSGVDLSIGGRRLPATASADLSLDVKTNALTLAGTWTAAESPGHRMDLLFGARMLKFEERLDYTITGDLGSIQLPGRSGRSIASQTNWDAIVGLTGRLRFGDGMRWFVPYYVDVGTGDSKLTWQAQAGLGYSFGWGDLAATYRYLAYDFESGGAANSLNLGGPTIGATFRW
jgi:hypothetical protein